MNPVCLNESCFKRTNPFVQIWGSCVDFPTGRDRRCKSGGRGLSSVPGDMDQEYERRLLRQINHQNLPSKACLTKVRSREVPLEFLSFFFSAVNLLVLFTPEPRCRLQSCQREVWGSLHPHQSWKQLEHQLPLCQRETFIQSPAPGLRCSKNQDCTFFCTFHSRDPLRS